MPFKSKAQSAWMFANDPEMAKKWAKHTPDMKNLPDRVDEMPHLETSISIDGKKVEVIDLCIEKYPIPGSEKSMYFRHFQDKGLVGRDHNGQWIAFKKSGADQATEEEIATLHHMPDYWESFAVTLTEVYAPSLLKFMRG